MHLTPPVFSTNQLASDHCGPSRHTTHVIFIKVRHDHGKIIVHISENCTSVSEKNVISTLKINIFLKFNVLRNTGCLLVPLNFEFKIKKYFKKRYDAFCKTSIQIFFENHHFFKLKKQRNRNSLALSLVVEFLKKIIFKEDMTLFLRLR